MELLIFLWCVVCMCSSRWCVWGCWSEVDANIFLSCSLFYLFVYFDFQVQGLKTCITPGSTLVFDTRSLTNKQKTPIITTNLKVFAECLITKD